VSLWRSSSNWKNTVSAAARPVRVDGLASHGATGRSRPAGRRLGEAHASGARSITDTLNDPLDVVEEMLEGSC
jgi:hypothetical protein